MFGRHVATNRLVSGAYKTEYGDASEIDVVMKRVQVGISLLKISCSDLSLSFL